MTYVWLSIGIVIGAGAVLTAVVLWLTRLELWK